MSKQVDYDEMFGTASRKNTRSDETESERLYRERCLRDAAERTEMSESVEEFRNRSKHREGFFDRSDSFASLEAQHYRNGYRRFHRRRNTVSLLDIVVDYFDGLAVGALLAIIAWKLTSGIVPITIAGTIGFIGGMVLKYRVHDRYSAQETLMKIIPAAVAAVIIAVYVLVKS